MKLTLDIETFSRANLKTAGMAKYAEDESTDLLCVCWAFDDGPVSAWIPTADQSFFDAVKGVYEWDAVFIGHAVPLELSLHIQRHGEIHAWNAAFERSVLNGPAGRRYGFPHITIEQTRCSMANARVHGLPGGLEDAANAVNAAVKKRMGGVNAMRYLCKPRADGTRPTLEEERKRFLELVPYCADDVRAERAVDAIVPPMTKAELEIYHLDQEFNDRGWKVDLEVIDNLEVLVHKYKQELEAKCYELTGIKPSRAGPLADWIRAHGYPELENLQADTVRKSLVLDIPGEVKTVLRLYSTYNMKTVTKFKALRQAAGSGARVRHMYMFYGAGTGRWSAHHIQNIFRTVIPDPENVVEIAKEWDLDYLRLMYPGVDPMKLLASSVRSVLIADEGKELFFPDYSGIEARFNSWVWNEKWKLDAYSAYDQGTGPNLYCVIYGRCFGIDPQSPEGVAGKQIGKVLDLSMGYEGGVGAFVKMARSFGIDLLDMVEKAYPTLPRDVLDESLDAYRYALEQGRGYELPERVWITCEGLKRLWRRAHPGISNGWRDLKDAALNATANPGKIYSVAGGRVAFRIEGDWLVMRLASGRKLWYYQPRIRDDDYSFGYTGVNTLTRQYGPSSMYGGSWCNNETQGGCRDLLVRAKMAMRDMKELELLGSSHDEPIWEIPQGWHEEEEVTRRMCLNGSWDAGLPLAVECHRGKRYRK